MFLVVYGANKSSRHNASMAHPVLSPIETLQGQGQHQHTLSLWISCSPIRSHGAGEATIGFHSFNTLSLQHAYLGVEGLKISSFRHQVSSYLLFQGQPVFLFLLWLLKSFFICGCVPEATVPSGLKQQQEGYCVVLLT